MSSSNAAPGGYRNLRAMWENKAADQSTSPPSRGRSPNGSTTSLQEKSLEKVKASFVAVEKAVESDQTQPTVSKPLNSTMDGTSEHSVEDNHGLGEILKGSPFLNEGAFPKEQSKESDANGVADRAAAMVKKMQQGNTGPPPAGDFVDPTAGPPVPKSGPHRPKPKSPVETPKSPAQTTKQPQTPKGPVVKPKGGVSKIQGVMESAARAKEERDATVKNAKQADPEPQNGTKTANKAVEEPQEPPRAPEPKPTNGTTETQEVSSSAIKVKETIPAAAVEPTKAAVSQTVTPKDSAKPSTIARAPRTSLPTRKPPSSTVVSTASSAIKADEPKLTEKKAAKAPLRVAATGTASSLAKKSSRASLNNNDGTKSRSATKPADEGFLARMMRPTASSAQKTHDKVQIASPPRPRQAPVKTLAAKASRRSLHQSDDYKENVPVMPVSSSVSKEVDTQIDSTEPQPAEANPS